MLYLKRRIERVNNMDSGIDIGVHKKRLVVVSFIAIILVAILFLNQTYSIFTTTDVDENTNLYGTGTLKISFQNNENAIKLIQSSPISDEEASLMEPYKIVLLNEGNVDYKFNLVLSDTTASDRIDTKYIKLKVNDGEIVRLSECKDMVIASDLIIKKGEKLEVLIKAWLADDVQNTEIGKSFYAKLTVDGYAVNASSEEQIDDSKVEEDNGLESSNS